MTSTVASFLAFQPTWPSAVIALAFMGLIGGLVFVAHHKDGMEGALKMWAALGTLVGILTGAIPTYFFSADQTEKAREDARNAEALAESTQQNLTASLGRIEEAHAQVAAANTRVLTMQDQLSEQIQLAREADERADAAIRNLDLIQPFFPDVTAWPTSDGFEDMTDADIRRFQAEFRRELESGGYRIPDGLRRPGGGI